MAQGQKHLPGFHWSATMGAHVGYESRLELSCLLMEDFDPSVRWIMSQPFQLSAPRGPKAGVPLVDAKRDHIHAFGAGRQTSMCPSKRGLF